MRMMPRRRLVRGTVRLPSFMDKEFDEHKRSIREVTAKLIKKNVSRRDPHVLCLPYYEALCVKAINAVLADATFVGCEQVAHVAEMFAEAAPGKKIEVRHMTLAAYGKAAVDPKRFDAAFLDYMGAYSQSRLEEIVSFVKTKMRQRFVLAVTMQGDDHVVESLTQDLAANIRQIELIYSTVYATQTQMCHSIFTGRP